MKSSSLRRSLDMGKCKRVDMTVVTNGRPTQERLWKTGLRHVVVGTDLSPESARALRRAALLPFVPGAELLVVHALPRRLSPAIDSIVRGAAEAKLEAACRCLRQDIAAVRGFDAPVHCRVLRGPAFQVLSRTASLFRTDLIVVGRRGTSRFRELVLGTTARRLLREGRHPILVVGRPPRTRYQTAVLGFDFSPEALRAARTVRRLLPPTGTFVAVHAFEDPLRGLPPALIPDRHAQHEDLTRERLSMVRRAMEASDRAANPWEVLVQPGDPRRLLLDTARARNADLIAVGSSGKSRLTRTMLGSVAEGVLEAAPGDVLLVRRRPAR